MAAITQNAKWLKIFLANESHTFKFGFRKYFSLYIKPLSWFTNVMLTISVFHINCAGSVLPTLCIYEKLVWLCHANTRTFSPRSNDATGEIIIFFWILCLIHEKDTCSYVLTVINKLDIFEKKETLFLTSKKAHLEALGNRYLRNTKCQCYFLPLETICT